VASSWPAATALAQAGPGPSDAQVLVAPAFHSAAENFKPALVCATVSVPLAQAWHVGEGDGRPALALSGTPVWSFRTLDTWPDGSVKWALCEALVVAGGDVQAPDLRVQTEPRSSADGRSRTSAGAQCGRHRAAQGPRSTSSPSSSSTS
jgi:hypothetical protein